MNTRKGLISIISTTLLIVVVVGAIIIFGNYLNQYSSKIYSDNEVKTNELLNDNFEILSLVGENIYLNGNNNDTVKEIIIGNTKCNFSFNVKIGVNSYNISDCLNETENGIQEITIVTNNSVKSKFIRIVDSNDKVSTPLIESNFKWVKVLENETGTNDDIFKTIAIDSFGNIYVAGNGYKEKSQMDFGNGVSIERKAFRDIFLVKYNPQGEAQWAKGMTGGISYDSVKDFAIDSNNNLYILGVTQSSDFNLGDGCSLSQVSYTNSEFFLAKYNSDGVCQWVKSTVPESSLNKDEDVRALAIDSNNNLYVAGFTYSALEFGNNVSIINDSNINIFLVKYNSSGDALWARNTLNGVNDENSNLILDIGIDNNDNLYLAGGYFKSGLYFDESHNLTKSSGLSNEDFFIAKYDELGNVMNLITSYDSGPNSDYIEEIDFDSKNNIYAVGTSYYSPQIVEGYYKASPNFQLFLKYNSSLDFQQEILFDQGGFPLNNIKIFNDEIYVGGYTYIGFSGTLGDSQVVINGSNGRDLYFGKFNSSYDGQWLVSNSNIEDSSDYIYDLAVYDNHLYVAGGTISSILQFDSDIEVVNQGLQDCFLLKYDD